MECNLLKEVGMMMTQPPVSTEKVAVICGYTPPISCYLCIFNNLMHRVERLRQRQDIFWRVRMRSPMRRNKSASSRACSTDTQSSVTRTRIPRLDSIFSTNPIHSAAIVWSS